MVLCDATPLSPAPEPQPWAVGLGKVSMAVLAEETLSECDEVPATPFPVFLDSEGP